MGGISVTIRNWWERADRTQKLISIGGVSIFLLLLVGTFLFASRPHYVVLYNGLSDSEEAKIVDQINGMGISAIYDVPGQVEVPSDKAQDVKMHLALSNALPKNAHASADSLGQMGLMTTPHVEQMRLQSISEGELDSTIERCDGVQSADVHLNMGQQSSLLDEAKPASASVTIIESSEGAITPKQAKAIASLVVSAVTGLELKNVTVVNQSLKILFDGSSLDEDDSGAPARFEYEQKYDLARETELQNVLDEVFGPGSTRVSVHSILDLDSQHSEIKTAKPSDEPVSTDKTIEKMNGVGSAATAIGKAASATNVQPTTPDPSAPKSGSGYSNSTTQETHTIDTSTIDTTKVPGTPKSVVFNVIADSTRLTDPADEAKLNSIVQTEVAGLGGDPQAFKTTVTMVAFDKTGAKQAAQAASSAISQNRMQQLTALLPVAALVFIAFMVMRQLGKFAKDQSAVLELGDGHLLSLPTDNMIGHGGEAGAAGLLAAIEGIPSHVHGDQHALDGAHFMEGDETVNVDAIKSKVHVPLEQIKKMANEKPIVVGMLIKSLLLEDKK